MKKSGLIFAGVFSLLCLYCVSQDFRKDFILLNEKIYKAKQLAFTLHYNMYLDNDLSKPVDERDIQVLRSSPYNLRCKDASCEFISNKDGAVFVNHQMKHIIIRSQAQEFSKGDELLNTINVNFDTLMMLFSKVNYKKLSESQIEYECVMKGGIYKKIKMVYNTVTRLPEKAVYFHRQPIRKNPQDDKLHSVVIEVVYKNFNFAPAISSTSFSYSKYISKKNKKFNVATAYSSYQLINLFDENNYEFEE